MQKSTLRAESPSIFLDKSEETKLVHVHASSRSL